jgi:hypothetical protein
LRCPRILGGWCSSVSQRRLILPRTIFFSLLQDAHDRKLGVEVSVDGTSIAEVSDGLQGEPYGERGWIRRYSEYAGTPCSLTM